VLLALRVFTKQISARRQSVFSKPNPLILISPLVALQLSASKGLTLGRAGASVYLADKKARE
jgi:hypothetical protein